MQINFLSSVLVAVTLRDLKVASYNISKAVPIFLLGCNELLEMQNACQISRQPDWQIDRPIMVHVHIQILVHRRGPRTRTSE